MVTLEDKKSVVRYFITEKCKVDGWDSLLSKEVRNTWKNVFNSELSSFEEFESWLQDLREDQKIDELWSELFFRYTTLCSIENVSDEIKAFFPKLVASYRIPNRCIINGGDIARDFCLESFGDVFDEKLKGCFFKLSSRSSKDCLKIRANSIDDIVYAFDSSLRMVDDVWLYFNYGYPINLNFYEWIEDCKGTNEVRCFIQKRKLKGISKYQINKPATYSSDFIDKVREFIESRVIPASVNWIGDFVVDCYEKEDGSVGVIEFNPYEQSDPCLYGSHKLIGTPLVIEEDIYRVCED